MTTHIFMQNQVLFITDRSTAIKGLKHCSSLMNREVSFMEIYSKGYDIMGFGLLRSYPSSIHLQILVTEQTILYLLFSFSQEWLIKWSIFHCLENGIFN